MLYIYICVCASITHLDQIPFERITSKFYRPHGIRRTHNIYMCTYEYTTILLWNPKKGYRQCRSLQDFRVQGQIFSPTIPIYNIYILYRYIFFFFFLVVIYIHTAVVIRMVYTFLKPYIPIFSVVCVFVL